MRVTLLERSRQRTLVATGLSLLFVAALLLLAVPRARGAGATFNAPVKVTPALGFGYEPATVVDRFGNIFVTAHKENWQLVLGADVNSPTYTRSMSWAWTSVDGGKSFVDIPGLTSLSLEQHQFGDEGDMALDDTNHLYFVDKAGTALASASLPMRNWHESDLAVFQSHPQSPVADRHQPQRSKISCLWQQRLSPDTTAFP